jgi:NifU-like protein involved in Fe-S cluster formation
VTEQESKAPNALSQLAERRLRKPRSRGIFLPVDAARRELALLSVADHLGQARLYWLVELSSTTIRDARFLAFGSRASHVLADAFCELSVGRTVPDACRLTPEQIESVLRDDPVTPAVSENDLLFIPQLQLLAEAEIPRLEVLPKPLENAVIPPKRQSEWNEQDKAWIPLGLLKKIGKIDQVVSRILATRFSGTAPSHRIENLNDYFRLQLKILGLTEDQLPTIAQLLQDALRSELHPEIEVEIISA